jgi:hypothetical protein
MLTDMYRAGVHMMTSSNVVRRLRSVVLRVRGVALGSVADEKESKKP